MCILGQHSLLHAVMQQLHELPPPTTTSSWHGRSLTWRGVRRPRRYTWRRKSSISPDGSRRRRRTTWHGFGPGKCRAAFSARKHPEDATGGNRMHGAKDVGRKPGFVKIEHLRYNRTYAGSGQTEFGTVNRVNRSSDTCHATCRTRSGRCLGFFCLQ
jgi:hypothetical protein